MKRFFVFLCLVWGGVVMAQAAVQELNDAPALVAPAVTATPGAANDTDAPKSIGPPSNSSPAVMEPESDPETESNSPSGEDERDATPPRPVEELKDAPPLAPGGSSGGERGAVPAHHSIFGDNDDSALLNVSARLDTEFQAGGSVQQGFSLPSVRLTAAGSTSEVIHYRLSFGETREFTSALLPQILPVEGYVEFRHVYGDPGGESRTVWRLGMFTPAFSPWWTPDLSDISLPDYHEIDKQVLLSRDLGAQFTYEPFSNHLSLTTGVFNGIGIFAQNTNSSHALVASVESRWNTGETLLDFGASGYWNAQASVGSLNYRSDVMGELFAQVDFTDWNLRVTGELLGGKLQDSTRTASPLGGAATLDLGLFSWVKAFVRAETLSGSGSGSGILQHFQMGPVFDLDRNVEAWLVYEYLGNGPDSGNPQQQVMFRLRLSV